jgi:putative phosphoesterase
VFGNTDNEELRRQCPEELVVDAGKVRIAVVHGDAWPPARRLDEMASRYGAVGVKAVIYGHTHVADVTRRKGVLLVNPGSAGKRNFGHALSVARMTVTGEDVSVEILPIEPAVEEP